MLAPDFGAVDVYVENAARALDQFHLRAVLGLKSLRQTGGLGLVVSFHAVLDPNPHGSFLLLGCEKGFPHQQQPTEPQALALAL